METDSTLSMHFSWRVPYSVGVSLDATCNMYYMELEWVLLAQVAEGGEHNQHKLECLCVPVTAGLH